jgi:hypothetical protein
MEVRNLQMSGMSNCSGMSKANLNSTQSVSSALNKPTERADVQVLNQEVQNQTQINPPGLGIAIDVKA